MSARRRASHPSAVLLAAVEGGDVYKVRELLDRGVDPLLSYKNTCAAEAAMNSGNEEMIRPFVEAFRRDPCASNLRNLHITTCRLFADDRFSASFAAEHAHDLRIELTGVREQGGDMHGVWGSLLLHGEINFSEYKPGRRDPGTLAAKVRVAIELG